MIKINNDQRIRKSKDRSLMVVNYGHDVTSFWKWESDEPGVGDGWEFWFEVWGLVLPKVVRAQVEDGDTKNTNKRNVANIWKLLVFFIFYLLQLRYIFKIGEDRKGLTAQLIHRSLNPDNKIKRWNFEMKITRFFSLQKVSIPFFLCVAIKFLLTSFYTIYFYVFALIFKLIMWLSVALQATAIKY